MRKSRLLGKWLFNERDIIRKIYFLAAMEGLMYLIIPLTIQGIITYIMAGSFTASLTLLSVVIVIAVIFMSFFQIWQMRINETLHQKIFGNLVSRINNYLNHTVPSDEIIKKLNQFFEIVTLQKGISKILLDFSFSVISIIFGLILLTIYSSWFVIFTLLLGGVLYFIIRYYGNQGTESNIKTSNEKYKIIGWFQQVANGRSAGQSVTETTDSHLQHYIIERSRHFRIMETQFIGIMIFKVIFIALLLLVGAFLVQKGELNIGQFIASELIIFLVINSVEKLVKSMGTFYDMITGIYKIENIFGGQREYSFLNTEVKELPSIQNIYCHPYSKRLKMLLNALLITGLVVLFLPWTQNVESIGKISTLNPANRPQTITSRIAGRIEKWYIREGDFVKKNDTIAFISEIKDDYVDPLLITRSEQQVKAKETTIDSYQNKIRAVNFQIDALNKALRLKLEQAKNKIIQAKLKLAADSIDAQTSANNYLVAEEQFRRFTELLDKGVISRTDLENRKVKVQEALSKKTSAENKFISAQNELLNAEIEFNSVQQDYAEKLMKAESEKFSALSLLYEGEGALTKLQNQLANYSMRRSFYYVLAPQDGFIAKTEIQGIGEIVKEGAALCNIVPKQDEQAVELYIQPIDLPLIRKGQTVQLIFDGWPAFVFSGWPGISYGTYSAEVVNFDKVVSSNGMFRVLAKRKGKEWPEALQMGGGVKGFAMLKDVPLIYEAWRKINGFPPDFYNLEDEKKNSEKKKNAEK